MIFSFMGLGKYKYFGFTILLALTLSSASAWADAFEAQNYEYKLRNLKFSYEPNDILDAAAMVSDYPTVEAKDTIKDRLTALFTARKRIFYKHDPAYDELILAFLDLFKTMAHQQDLEFIFNLKKLAPMKRFDPKIPAKIDEVARQIHNVKNRALPTFNDLRSNPPEQVMERFSTKAEDHREALQEAKAFYERMAAEVKGQEKILKSFLSMHLKDLLSGGQRLAPEVFYLMGLPGNGKDTIAEAYVRALWHDAATDPVQEHLFRMNIRSKNESWTYFGSSKGYVGSEELPDLLRFLVEHSGGRYILGKEKSPQGGERHIVELNPEYNPLENPNAPRPHQAVIFVNEAHNIPKEVKDNVLKQAIERGIFTINNPGSSANSVSTIELPVTFIFASNEGIELLEPREKNGSRQGEPLPYERLLENYNLVADDKPALKQSILKANGEINNPVQGIDALGTSEEFLNRIPDHRLHILKPLSPEILKEIVELRVHKIADGFFKAEGQLGKYEITISKELVDFVVNYKYVASENARPINSRLDSFIFDQIYEALLSEKIRPLGTLQHIHVDLKEYSNGVHSAVFVVTDKTTGKTYQFSRIISETLRDRTLRPITYERIQEIAKIRLEILEQVFGVEHIVDALIEAAVVAESESRNAGDNQRPATVMAFLGKTSTGKTEMAKRFVMARYGKDERPMIIDFNNIKSLDALEAKILGSYDSRRNPIPSDFMKAYDRAKGNLAFIFDEAANSPKELLMSLYEILREPIVTGFSDGKPRSMAKVSIILTGNAGEKIYADIPTHLPSEIYEKAMYEAFRLFLSDQDQQNKILKETFPEALLARIGKNIYHFGPLTHSMKRQLAQSKLLKGIESLKPKASEIGWHISFVNEESLLRIFDMIEREGFNHAYQGASIDQFVREAIIDKIKTRLLMEGIPNGAKVTVDLGKDSVVKSIREMSQNYRTINISVDGREFTVEIPTGVKKASVKRNAVDRVLTAYHEAGHEIVSEVYFGDRIRPKFLSIIEGVSIMGDRFVHYAGIRVGENIERIEITKEVILRQAAIFAGGYVAQSFVTLGGRHDAGKNDDILRSTQFIRDAILRYGLSEEWGVKSIPDGVSTEDYISKVLSNEEKNKINEITSQWLLEAEKLAWDAILVNAERLFLNMGKEIARQGYLTAEEILDLYKDNASLTERDGERYKEAVREARDVIHFIDETLKQERTEFDARFNDQTFSLEKSQEAFEFLTSKNTGKAKSWNQLSKFQQFISGVYISKVLKYESRDAHLSSPLWMPEKVADIEQVILKDREAQTRPVTKFESFDILNTELKASRFKSSLRCTSYLQ